MEAHRSAWPQEEGTGRLSEGKVRLAAWGRGTVGLDRRGGGKRGPGRRFWLTMLALLAADVLYRRPGSFVNSAKNVSDGMSDTFWRFWFLPGA